MPRLLTLLLFSLHLLPLCAAPPQRIISLSPNTTEILAGIGAFPQVVAVSQYCTYPPETATLPKISGWANSNIEAVVALRPDLVVLTKDQEPFLAERLTAFHLQWIATPSQNLADVFTAVDEIGSATGHQTQARELANQMHRDLDAIGAATGGLPHPSVVLSVSRTPGTLSELYVATPGSYLINLVEIAGGRSIVAPAAAGYAKLNKEALLSLNPDVVLDMMHRSEPRMNENPISAWSDLPDLKAVKLHRIYLVDDPFAPHPSQFVVRTAQVFERLLHPEIKTPGGR